MGVKQLIVESDCLPMIKFCVSKDRVEELHACSEIRILVAEIQDFIARFEDYKLQQTYREYNRPAHLLARYAWNVDTKYCGKLSQAL